MRKKRLLYITTFLVLAAILTGCQGVKFYTQAIGGQFELFRKQKPIEKILANPDTDPKLKRKLELVLAVRQFAQTNLHLEPEKSYLRYADLHRECVVWNVYAASEFSLEPKSWWYPFVGRAKYRGYFAEKNANAYAERLRRKGYEVYVEGAEAYSTLGWFEDPLLNTFIFHSDASLAETIFHELAHKRLFVSGDTDFNEAFATAVGEEGARRWLKTVDDETVIEKYSAAKKRKEDFVHLVQQTREHLKSVYGTREKDEKLDEATAAQLRKQKQEVVEQAREQYKQLKVKWGGYSGYDEWFNGPLNNAQLSTIANYYDLVPAFEEMLKTAGGDLEKFYGAVKALTKESKAERHRKLKDLLPPKNSV